MKLPTHTSTRPAVRSTSQRKVEIVRHYEQDEEALERAVRYLLSNLTPNEQREAA